MAFESCLSGMVHERQMEKKWRVLLTIKSPPLISLPLLARLCVLSAYHIGLLSHCSLHSCHMRFLQGFGKALLSLITGPWHVVASVCNALYLFPLLKLMPPFSFPLSSRSTSSGDRLPILKACPSSWPTQVLCYMSSMHGVAFLPSTSLSMWLCSWAEVGQVWFPQEDGSALRTGTVLFFAHPCLSSTWQLIVYCTNEAHS